MEFEIQVVVWDRHKYVAGFNQLFDIEQYNKEKKIHATG
jgi:hypothetical protein